MSTTQALKSIFVKTKSSVPPTKEEERELLAKVQEGNLEAEAELIERNLRMVVDLARRYHPKGTAFEDLVQEGSIGLVKAARRFDLKKETRFSTYAHWWIRQAISRFVKGPTRTIRLPEYVHDKVAKVFRTQSEMETDLGRVATIKELDQALGFGEEKIREFLDTSHDVASLDGSLDSSEGLTLADTLSDTKLDPEREASRRENVAEVEKGLSHLSGRQAEILAHRYGFVDGNCRSRPWIGKKLGLSAERIRQLENSALSSLRQSIAA